MNYTITRTNGSSDRRVLEVTCTGCHTTWSYSASDIAANLAADLDRHDAVHDDARLTWTPELNFTRLAWLGGHR